MTIITIQKLFLLLLQSEEYRNEVKKLWDALMGLEMQLVDQLEETIKEFERNISDMMSQFVESVQGLYLLCCLNGEFFEMSFQIF